MDEAVILSGIRTPIGAFGGALSTLTAPQLGSAAIKAALDKSGISAEDVDEVLFGQVLQGGVGQAPSRQAALGAGLPNSVPCTTVNKVCGSGMKTIMMAAQAIACNDGQFIVAGGMESMSQAPYFSPTARTGLRMGDAKLIDMMIWDGLWDPYSQTHMGSCGDLCASELNYSREQIDAYATESYKRALAAQERCVLSEEIVPVAVPQRKGDPVMVSEDEEPKKGDVTKLAGLKPAFGKEGVTTAGNASSIDDGAAALVIASLKAAEAKGLKPLARIVAYAQHAQEPQWFTTAPSEAIFKVLKKAGLDKSQIDIWEVNEAFSVVAMNVADKVGIPNEKLNVNGGAVALGHPIGMTGGRLVLTAMHELRRRGGKYALATPCIGGGEATAIIIEAL
jgi:acetyl-CoA C-acetyltransferase